MFCFCFYLLGCFCSVFLFYLNLKLLIIGESISCNQLPVYIYTVFSGHSQHPQIKSQVTLIFSKLKYHGPGATYCPHTRCNTLPSLLFILACMTPAMYVPYNDVLLSHLQRVWRQSDLFCTFLCMCFI